MEISEIANEMEAYLSDDSGRISVTQVDSSKSILFPQSLKLGRV